jgi:long-chain fatty acid transport protein
MRFANNVIFLSLLCVITTQSNPLHASGYRLSFFGAPDNGVCLAGEAAHARDASTALTNPAGMTWLDSSQFIIPMQPFAFWSFWDIDEDATTFNGNKGGNCGACNAGMAGAIAYQISDKLAAGFGFYTPGAISQNFDRNSKMRFFTQRDLFVTFTGNWSLAYQATCNLSFGAGFSIGYGYNNSAVALPNEDGFTTLPNADRIKFNLDNWKRVDLGKLAYGYNFGAIYQITPCTRVGLTYNSQLNFRLHGTTETITTTTGAVYSSCDLTYKIPMYMVFSVYHKMNCSLALLANIGWDNWSILKEATIKFKDGTSASYRFNWHDTMSFALGAEYQKSQNLTLLGGISYDTSPVTSKDRVAALSFANALYIGTGMIYKLNKCETVSFTANYGVSIPRGKSVDETLGDERFKGKLNEDTAILGLSYNRKFGKIH